MKESKDEAILPCYRDGYGVWHYLDDTHGKVYELNKQMCDLGIPSRYPIKPLSEETAQELIGRWEKIGEEWASKKKEIVESIFGNITIEKSNIMEKKTNKMTKAEAFEWLKHKKVAVTGDTITLQNKLLNIGYKWCDGSIVAMPMIDFFLIDDETFQFTESLSHFRNCGYTEISADDILSIEIVEEKKEETENINIELEKWIGVIRDKFCCSGWSFVISASNFALVSGDLIEEKRIKD